MTRLETDISRPWYPQKEIAIACFLFNFLFALLVAKMPPGTYQYTGPIECHSNFDLKQLEGKSAIVTGGEEGFLEFTGSEVSK